MSVACAVAAQKAMPGGLKVALSARRAGRAWRREWAQNRTPPARRSREFLGRGRTGRSGPCSYPPLALIVSRSLITTEHSINKRKAAGKILEVRCAFAEDPSHLKGWINVSPTASEPAPDAPMRPNVELSSPCA